VKATRLAVLFTIAILTTSTSVISTHAAGRTAASIPNTILNGRGAPDDTLGINGDFYIDIRSILLYGPKAKGKWPLPQNLQGPTGAAGTSGSDGKNGSDAKTVSNASTSAGPAGPQGEKGLTGATGPAGSSGPAGATGPAGSSGSGGGTPGATGATGATGAAGAAGSTGPTGATGSTGAAGTTGTAGSNGTAGAAGATGPAGATGSAGISGISKAITGTFTIGDISGAIGTSNFGSVTGFKANKSYVVHIKIYAYQPDDSGNYFLPMSLSFAAINGTPAVTSNYSTAQGSSYRTGSTRYENSFSAEVTLDGTGVDTDYGIRLTVIAGRSTASFELVKFVGSYVALQVDSITATF
jgi:hypothetical protein